jgi:hypothetical protein
MKAEPLLVAFGLFCFLAAPSWAQVVPATPTRFTTRPIGEATASTGATVNGTSKAAPVPTVRQVTTYLTLSPLRQWNSTDGKARMGKLIAWEETVTTTKGPAAAPAPPSEPITTKPTILKDNKARLLIDNKAYEVPLERLAAEEQKFITELQAAIAAKP